MKNPFRDKQSTTEAKKLFVQTFKSLFRANTNKIAWYGWHPKRDSKTREILRNPNGEKIWIREWGPKRTKYDPVKGKGSDLPPLNFFFHNHLKGKDSYGIYLLTGTQNQNDLSWIIAWDLDDLTAQDDAEKLVQTLKDLGIPPECIILEDSGGLTHVNKKIVINTESRKVWVLMEYPMLATDARAFGQYALEKANLPQDIEVFPKQRRALYGNLIRLPMGIHHKYIEDPKIAKELGYRWSDILSHETIDDIKTIRPDKLPDIPDDWMAKSTYRSTIPAKWQCETPKEVDEIIEHPAIRPCVRALIYHMNDRIEGAPENDYLNVLIAAELLAAGFSVDDIVEVFRRHYNKFKEETTRERVQDVLDRNTMRFGREKLTNRRLCNGCGACSYPMPRISEKKLAPMLTPILNNVATGEDLLPISGLPVGDKLRKLIGARDRELQKVIETNVYGRRGETTVRCKNPNESHKKITPFTSGVRWDPFCAQYRNYQRVKAWTDGTWIPNPKLKDIPEITEDVRKDLPKNMLYALKPRDLFISDHLILEIQTENLEDRMALWEEIQKTVFSILASQFPDLPPSEVILSAKWLFHPTGRDLDCKSYFTFLLPLGFHLIQPRLSREPQRWLTIEQFGPLREALQTKIGNRGKVTFVTWPKMQEHLLDHVFTLPIHPDTPFDYNTDNQTVKIGNRKPISAKDYILHWLGNYPAPGIHLVGGSGGLGRSKYKQKYVDLVGEYTPRSEHKAIYQAEKEGRRQPPRKTCWVPNCGYETFVERIDHDRLGRKTIILQPQNQWLDGRKEPYGTGPPCDSYRANEIAIVEAVAALA